MFYLVDELDQETKDYRKAQFKRLDGQATEFKATLKISNEYGATNNMDITEGELEAIIRLLTTGTTDRG